MIRVRYYWNQLESMLIFDLVVFLKKLSKNIIHVKFGKYVCYLWRAHIEQLKKQILFCFSWLVQNSSDLSDTLLLLSHQVVSDSLCDPMHCSAPGHPVPHCLPELAQVHVPWVGDAVQPSHPLTPSSPLACSLSQHQGLFWWVGSSHQVYHIRCPDPPKKVISHAFAWPHSMATGRKEVFVGNPVLQGCMDPPGEVQIHTCFCK